MKSPLIINPEQEVDKIIRFLKKTFKQQKIDKAVLGLSGGIDSTVALYLLKKALPSKNIYAVQMDYKPREKLKIDLKGINVVKISIKKIVDQFEGSATSQVAKNLSRSPLANNIRVGNIMARVRMIILFDLAKQLGALVCGTENKSEKLLGYFTRFGDAASDIEPISHLYKTQVYQLARYLKVSDQIINQPPTAGLWNGQTDENDFGFTYQEADQVLYLFNDRNLETKEIEKLGYKNAGKIVKRVKNNQFKQDTPYSLK